MATRSAAGRPGGCNDMCPWCHPCEFSGKEERVPSTYSLQLKQMVSSEICSCISPKSFITTSSSLSHHMVPENCRLSDCRCSSCLGSLCSKHAQFSRGNGFTQPLQPLSVPLALTTTFTCFNLICRFCLQDHSTASLCQLQRTVKGKTS